FLWTFETDARERAPEYRVAAGKNFTSCRILIHEILSHADLLGALSGEKESDAFVGHWCIRSASTRPARRAARWSNSAPRRIASSNGRGWSMIGTVASKRFSASASIPPPKARAGLPCFCAN